MKDEKDLNKTIEEFMKNMEDSWEVELSKIKELVKDVDKGYKIIYYGMKKKNVGITALLSLLLPGIGHLYIGKITRGLIIVGIYIISVFLSILIIGIITTPLIILYSIYDSCRLAKDYNNKLFKVIFEDGENVEEIES